MFAPMSRTAEFIADTTELRVGPRWAQPLVPQPFEDALTSLRVEGSILLHGHHRPPWAVDVPSADNLRELMKLPGNVRVVPFHLVLEGNFDLHFEDEAPLRLEHGQIVMCTDGTAHRMSQGKGARVRAFENVLTTGRWRMSSEGRSPAGSETELVCGGFSLRSDSLNPLIAALPRVLIVDTRAPGANPMLAHIVAMIELELARSEQDSFAASRLIEILFAEALKDHARSAGVERAGWFKALQDPKVGRALAVIHQQIGEPLTVEMLAQAAAISPSRFAARFRETMGQSVMAYVSQWRMNIACRKLAETQLGLSEIAALVGYQDTAAFSRAFKALVGQSPAHWRSSKAR